MIGKFDVYVTEHEWGTLTVTTTGEGRSIIIELAPDDGETITTEISAQEMADWMIQRDNDDIR